MRTTILDKMIYIKNVKHMSKFKIIHKDILVPWSTIKNITYCYSKNETKFEFKNCFQGNIYSDGNVLESVIETLNRDYTRGVIIEDNGKVKEML